MLKNSVEYKRFVWELSSIIDCSLNDKAVTNINNTTILNNYKNITFICIGTNLIIGDAFGPIVGSVLKNTIGKKNRIKIIGDLKNCITYNNIKDKIKNIKKMYSNDIIIVLDSAISHKSDIGKVFIQNRGLKYGESLKKENECIGDISIKAVVCEQMYDNISNFKNLTQVSENQIQNVCSLVSLGIIDVLNKKGNFGKNIYK